MTVDALTLRHRIAANKLDISQVLVGLAENWEGRRISFERRWNGSAEMEALAQRLVELLKARDQLEIEVFTLNSRGLEPGPGELA